MGTKLKLTKYHTNSLYKNTSNILECIRLKELHQPSYRHINDLNLSPLLQNGIIWVFDLNELNKYQDIRINQLFDKYMLRIKVNNDKTILINLSTFM